MAKKIKEKLDELFSEQTIKAATDQSDSTLQNALDTLQQAASSNSANMNISAVSTAKNNWLYDSNSITNINDSYTINGYGYGNYVYSNNYGLQANVKLQADNVYIEYNGTEYRLSDIMFKLKILEDLLDRYPNLIVELADMAEKLSKLEQDIALQKLDKVINS